MSDYGSIAAMALMAIVVLSSPMSTPSKIQFMIVLAMMMLGIV